MTNFDYYLTNDHSARRRTTAISVGAGAFVGAVGELSGAPFREAVIATVLATGVLEIILAVTYREPSKRDELTVSPFPRRDLVRTAVAFATVLVAFLVRIPRIEALPFERKLQRVTVNPTDPSNIHAASQILERARIANVAIPPDVIENTGKKFLEGGTPEAWSTSLAFLSYRSFLNARLVSPPSNAVPATSGVNGYHFSVFITTLPPRQLIRIRQSGSAPDENSALLDSLSNPPPPGTGSGAQTLIVDVPSGGGISLDMMRMKNVIVRNAIVSYTGKPVQLTNVVFLNCMFQFERTRTGTRLGQELLAETNLNFSTSITA